MSFPAWVTFPFLVLGECLLPGAEEAVLASLVSSGRAQEVEKHNLKGSEKPEGQFQKGECSLTNHKNNLGSFLKNMDRGTD